LATSIPVSKLQPNSIRWQLSSKDARRWLRSSRMMSVFSSVRFRKLHGYTLTALTYVFVRCKSDEQSIIPGNLGSHRIKPVKCSWIAWYGRFMTKCAILRALRAQMGPIIKLTGHIYDKKFVSHLTCVDFCICAGYECPRPD